MLGSLTLRRALLLCALSGLAAPLVAQEGDRSGAEVYKQLCVVCHGENGDGKGLIQRVFPLPDGGELKLTIGEYLRPTKQHVRRGVGGGIQPDLRCAATPWGGEGAAPDTCVRRAAEWIGAADALADAGAVADRGSLLQLSRPL